MKVGVLELLALPAKHTPDAAYHLLISKQYAGIMPQTISAWCRQLKHETYYATYYGVGNLYKLLPNDLDVVFISCCSQYAPLAYSLAKVYRQAGVLTVTGGPHASAFPTDCLRFFDIVVKECDLDLLKRILAKEFEPGSYISCTQALQAVASVAEREPEIRKAAYFGRRWRSPLITSINIISSMGCPYTCGFCSDWNKPYRVLPLEQLREDFEYVSKHMPGAVLAFNDPNFAIKFEQVFEVLEGLPQHQRVPYFMECSLSILNEERLRRLKDTGCLGALFGIESWYDYSNKSGAGNKQDAENKLKRLLESFELLRQYLGYLQVHFIFGVDGDAGNEPVELTKAFMQETPYVWPVLNTPVPFGNTPWQEELLKQGRVLTQMPFMFYYAPNLTIIPKNYELIDYFEKLIELSDFLSSDEMLKRRLKSTNKLSHKMAHRVRTYGEKGLRHQYQSVLNELRQDPNFLAFHEGRSQRLPDFYRQQTRQYLGRYMEPLSEDDLVPDFSLLTPTLV